MIVAGGQSRRMSGLDKTFAPLLGKPLILHTLEVFLQCEAIGPIALVLADANIERGRKLVEDGLVPSRVTLCTGGLRRQDSARRGLQVLKPCHWVAVHDGARPCLDLEVLNRAIAQAQQRGNAVVAVPPTDTIKTADAHGVVTSTLAREGLWAVQTPQVFPFSVLKKAYELENADATDDASLVERLGMQAHLVQGSYDNIKVTSPQDLALAETILSHREKQSRKL